MAASGKTFRYAGIEYQPNTQRPVQPYPLGVIVEDGSGDDRRVLLVGRPSLEGLDLRELWGPFKNEITNWFAEFSRNIDELMRTADRRTSVIDALARQWHSNLYVKEAEVRPIAGKGDIDRATMSYYEELVGESLSKANVHKRTAAQDMVPA